MASSKEVCFYTNKHNMLMKCLYAPQQTKTLLCFSEHFELFYVYTATFPKKAHRTFVEFCRAHLSVVPFNFSPETEKEGSGVKILATPRRKQISNKNRPHFISNTHQPTHCRGSKGQVRPGLHASGEPVLGRRRKKDNMYTIAIYMRQKLTNECKCQFHTTSWRAASLHDPRFAYLQYA